MPIDNDAVVRWAAALLASAIGVGLLQLNLWHSRTRKAHPQPDKELNTW